MNGADGRRRRFLAGLSALGAGALMPGCASGPAAGESLERNKAVALRFKKLQGTKDESLIEKEVLAPGYRRPRGGMLNLAITRLQSRPAATQSDRNKIVVARSKSSKPPKDDRGADYKQLRQGFQHLRDYGVATGTAKQKPTSALPDRSDFVDDFIAEGDTVWMKFRIAGTQKGPLYGHPPTGLRVEMPEIGVARFRDGSWISGWYFGDELGMMLQLGALHMLKH